MLLKTYWGILNDLAPVAEWTCSSNSLCLSLCVSKRHSIVNIHASTKYYANDIFNISGMFPYFNDYINVSQNINSFHIE